MAPSSGFFLKSGSRTTEFTFFISSGNDLLPQRNLFEEMVRVTDQQLRLRGDPSRRVRLAVDRWEQAAPTRASEAINAEFVRRAKEAHVTVVLLHEDIRVGTKEELEGVLTEDDVQLSVVWMQPVVTRNRALKKLLKDHQDDFLYCTTGEPGSPTATIALLRVLQAAVADITNPQRSDALFGAQIREESFFEERN